MPRKQFPSEETLGNELLKMLKGYGVDLISQNGWWGYTPDAVTETFKSMIVNQHPGPLDPGRVDSKGRNLDFGGRGMYASRVAGARLAYSWVAGEKYPFTETTTNHVTPGYDSGNLIRVNRLDIPTLARPVTIADLRNDPKLQECLVRTTEQVKKALLPLEHENVITTLRRFAEEKSVPGFRRTQPLIPDGNERILFQAKKLARDLFPKG